MAQMGGKRKSEKILKSIYMVIILYVVNGTLEVALLILINYDRV